MSSIAQKPSSFIGQAVGNGQCVAYVQQASAAPQTALWRRGELVKGGNVAQGTAIVTFDPSGVYGNHIDGRSHAAIFHQRLPEGLLVWDQWFNHPVEPRVIRFRNGDGAPANDGRNFMKLSTHEDLLTVTGARCTPPGSTARSPASWPQNKCVADEDAEKDFAWGGAAQFARWSGTGSTSR